LFGHSTHIYNTMPNNRAKSIEEAWSSSTGQEGRRRGEHKEKSFDKAYFSDNKTNSCSGSSGSYGTRSSGSYLGTFVSGMATNGMCRR
jgi:hypothetical protein